MEELLRILEKNARMPIEDIAAVLSKTPEEVAAMMDEAVAKGYIRGYETLVDWEKAGVNLVEAVIELRVTPHKSCGFDDIYLYRCADAFSPKAVRASMSGIFKARVYEVNYGECKTLLTGTNSYALDMDGDNLFKANLIGKVVFVAGSEAHGVSDEIKMLCKGSVALPMGNNMESLNVAVATGVAMYYTVNTNN